MSGEDQEQLENYLELERWIEELHTRRRARHLPACNYPFGITLAREPCTAQRPQFLA